jgi:hypothetical protein
VCPCTTVLKSKYTGPTLVQIIEDFVIPHRTRVRKLPFYERTIAIHARESGSRALYHLRPLTMGALPKFNSDPALGSHLGQWALILRMPCTLVLTLTYYIRNTHKLFFFFFFESGLKAHLPWLPTREREREYGYVGTLFIKVYIVRLEHSSEALFLMKKKQTPFSVVLGEKNFGFIFFPSRSLSFRQLSHSAISHNANPLVEISYRI